MRKSRIGMGLVGVLLLGTCGLNVVQHADRNKYHLKVTGTERITESHGKDEFSSKYVVFGQDAYSGASLEFENTDSTMECLFNRCKWDSSSLQSKLAAAEKSGQAVDVHTYGWRIPFLSQYENIVSVK